VAIIESALIFEVERDARLRGESEGVLISWRRRFDRVVAVTAPKELRVARYVARIANLTHPAVHTGETSPTSTSEWEEKIAADARSRIASQLSDEEKAARADFVIDNSGDLGSFIQQADAVWRHLSELSSALTQATA
jgi:dephospho-CoA kinase